MRTQHLPVFDGTVSLYPCGDLEWKVGGRDRDRTCGLIHAMDALSQLSYTPVTQGTTGGFSTAIILTNIQTKFHCDG